MTGLTQPLLFQLVAASIDASRVAGDIIRRIMRDGQLHTVDKSMNDPQTEADRQAQEHIVSSLKAIWPALHVIGEEGDIGHNHVHSDATSTAPSTSPVYNHSCPDDLQDVDLNRIVVWCDPLDGTLDFTKGLVNAVTVLIGIAVDGRPKAGIVHQPYFGNDGRTVWGIVGLGCFGRNFTQPPSSRLCLATTSSHPSPAINKAVEVIEPSEVLKIGGAGNKVLQILDGVADAYVFPSKGTKKWDTCAPEACLIAAGGLLTDCDGQIYSYSADTQLTNNRGLLATLNPRIHEHCIQRIKAANITW